MAEPAAPIAVTGASGGIGGQVARALTDAGVAVRLIGRDPTRLPDLSGAEVAVSPGYSDTASMQAAFAGTRVALLVSGRESADRMAEHRSVIDAAVAAGVRRVVYTSFFGASADCTFTFGRDHWHTEQYIRSVGLDFTFLRDNFYLDILPHLAGADGVVRGPAGSGRLAAVARSDVAEIAARVLREPGHKGATYDLTGPEALTLEQVAAHLSESGGRPVRYEEESVEAAYASRAHFNAPPFEVDGWVSTYVAIARGELDTVTGDAARLLGHPPQTLLQFLAGLPAEDPGNGASLDA